MKYELDYLYDKQIECLVCKQKYATKKVLSKYVRAHTHDSDFCSYYTSEKNNPLLYYVSVCPSCGYSSSDEFSRDFAPRTLDSIKEKICNNWGDLNYCEERSVDQAINTYKLGIYSALLKKEKHIAIAGLYLRLAWIYRTHSKEKEEHRFLSLALEEYIASYMEDDFSGTHLSEIKLFYLIGELSRRTDNVAQATRYFSMVIEKQKDTTEKGIVEMAKERWAEMRQRKLG